MRYRSLTASRDCTSAEPRLLIGPRLDLVQLSVMSAAGHELVMAADLGHVSAVEHDDDVCHPDGAEPVRYQDRDASVAAAVAGPAGVLLEEFVLRLGVERGRRLIKRHDEGVVAR